MSMNRHPVFAFLLTAILAVGGIQQVCAEDLTTKPSVISLDSSILFALHQNPELLGALEKEKESEFAIDEARSAYYPQVSAKLKGGREYNDPALASVSSLVVSPGGVSNDSYSAQMLVNQLLFDGFSTDEEVERRKSLKTSASLQTELAIEKILNDTITAYVAIWHYQRGMKECGDYVGSIKKITDKIDLMNEAGAESTAKKEYVDSRLAAAQSELDLTQAELTNAISDLEALTGTLPAFVAVRPDQFDPTVREMDKYYEAAHAANTNLQLNQSDRDALVHQRESAEGADYPTLSLQMEGFQTYDVGGPIGRVRGASAMMVMDYKLFDGFAHQSTADRIGSEITENDYQEAKLERDIRSDIRKAYNQILATKQDLRANRNEILASRKLQELYNKQFELGEGDIINIVEGYERLHAAETKGLKLEADMVLNSYALLRQIGALKKSQFCTSC
jgi:adhesin transport system outer membrane protein